MVEVLRPARVSECAALTELCLHSKSHWGHDAAFTNACRAELTLSETDIAAQSFAVLCRDDRRLGIVQVAVTDRAAEFCKLLVDPDAMGRGYGRRLFDWAVYAASYAGARTLSAEADPQPVSIAE